ncbi:hypothetical protein BDQ17DRAFT_1434880 [Cyathus striatus]|nr:hypothetical protein BDQ17DRAFT_1434880 [Cyathus striatus]
MTFYIDGENVGQFERIPPASDWEYNVLVYSNSSLAARSHQFTLTNGQYGYGGQKSLILFDYLVYSFEIDIESLTTSLTQTSSTMSPISTPSTPPISQGESPKRVRTEVVRVVIPVVGVIIICLITWYWVRHCRRRSNGTPFGLRCPPFGLRSCSRIAVMDPYNMRNSSSQTIVRRGLATTGYVVAQDIVIRQGVGTRKSDLRMDVPRTGDRNGQAESQSPPAYNQYDISEFRRS